MKVGIVFTVIYMVFCSNALALEKTLRVTTSIDINNLYTNAITNVEFFPSNLELTPKPDKTAFESISTTLKVNSDIPMSVNAVAYTSTLTSVNSSCLDYLGVNTPQPEFTMVSFDGQNITLGDSIVLSDFNSDDGTYKYSEHQVELIFKPFETILSSGIPKSCRGEVEFTIGVGI